MINCSFLTDKKITILVYENDCDTKNVNFALTIQQ